MTIIKSWESETQTFCSEANKCPIGKFENSAEGKVKAVKATVCHVYGITEEQLMSNMRHKKYSWPRHLAIGLSRQMTALSTTELGALFNRHYTSVINATKQINRKGDLAGERRQDIDKVIRILRGVIA